MTIKCFHSKEFVYRDFKLDNIIIDMNKNGIIIDFDRLVEINEQKTTDLGSEFLSPEYYKKLKCSYETDTFSFECIIFYFISGKKPNRNNLNKKKKLSLELGFLISKSQCNLGAK